MVGGLFETPTDILQSSIAIDPMPPLLAMAVAVDDMELLVGEMPAVVDVAVAPGMFMPGMDMDMDIDMESILDLCVLSELGRSNY